MFRCLTRGCPLRWGTTRRAGCRDRMLFHVLMFLLMAVIVASLAIGIVSLHGVQVGGEPAVRADELVQSA